MKQAATFDSLAEETFIKHPEALEEVTQMSSGKIEESLDDRFSRENNLTLDFSSKLLLVSWVQGAPEEALTWVWDRVLSKCLPRHPSWSQLTNLVFSEWAASDPTAASKWIIDHHHDGSSPPPSTMHLGSLHFRASWFHRAPVADYLKLYHYLEERSFGQHEDFLAHLNHANDLQTILTSWDQVSPERIARHDQFIVRRKANVNQAVPDSKEHTQARQRLQWAKDARAKALGEMKNPLIEATIKRWQEIDPEGWASSRFSRKEEWQSRE